MRYAMRMGLFEEAVRAPVTTRTVRIRAHVEIADGEIRYRFGCVQHKCEAGGTVVTSTPDDPAMLAFVADAICTVFDANWCGCFREIEARLPALLRVPCDGLVAEFRIGVGL